MSATSIAVVVGVLGRRAPDDAPRRADRLAHDCSSSGAHPAPPLRLVELLPCLRKGAARLAAGLLLALEQPAGRQRKAAVGRPRRRQLPNQVASHHRILQAAEHVLHGRGPAREARRCVRLRLAERRRHRLGRVARSFGELPDLVKAFVRIVLVRALGPHARAVTRCGRASGGSASPAGVQAAGVSTGLRAASTSASSSWT